MAAPRTRRRTVALVATALATCLAAGLAVVLAIPAAASTKPVVTGLSRHTGLYWGGDTLTVTGANFTGVTTVLFGKRRAWSVRTQSATTLTVTAPDHATGTVDVRVVTGSGRSTAVAADRFTFRYPTMDTPIYGGLTARQEQGISARVRARHRPAWIARGSRRWTPAMGDTARRRARSWIGLPYSWAGGNGWGPTAGVCQHNGGDNDCHVVGFDCSGLAMYAWWPYIHLTHYAATQYWQAGRFHPSIGQLMAGDLVFFSGYIPGGIGHVAVYAGYGMVIQAAESGTTVMRSRLSDVIANNGAYRGATRPLSTGRQGPGPVPSSSTARIAATGGLITITGRRLGGTTAVQIGATMVYRFARRTATRLVVRAPAHAAGRVTVAVSNAWGTARRTLTYVGAPTVTALAPSQGPAGTNVTVTGQNLAGATSVTVAGASVPFHAVDATHLAVSMPAHADGPVTVQVTTPFGRSAASTAATFTYVSTPVNPPPTTTPPGTPTATQHTVGAAPSSPTTPTTPSSPSTTSPGAPATTSARTTPTPTPSGTPTTPTPTATSTTPATTPTPTPTPTE